MPIRPPHLGLNSCTTNQAQGSTCFCLSTAASLMSLEHVGTSAGTYMSPPLITAAWYLPQTASPLHICITISRAPHCPRPLADFPFPAPLQQ
ncbi:hypothetical protein FKM82_008466 [Ascaphus truei]